MQQKFSASVNALGAVLHNGHTKYKPVCIILSIPHHKKFGLEIIKFGFTFEQPLPRTLAAGRAPLGRAVPPSGRVLIPEPSRCLPRAAPPEGTRLTPGPCSTAGQVRSGQVRSGQVMTIAGRFVDQVGSHSTHSVDSMEELQDFGQVMRSVKVS